MKKNEISFLRIQKEFFRSNKRKMKQKELNFLKSLILEADKFLEKKRQKEN